MDDNTNKNSEILENGSRETLNNTSAPDKDEATENISNSELNDILDQNQDDSSNEEDNAEEPIQKPDYEKEIIDIIRGNASPKYMRDKLDDYHENDIAEVLSKLTIEERKNNDATKNTKSE